MLSYKTIRGATSSSILFLLLVACGGGGDGEAVTPETPASDAMASTSSPDPMMSEGGGSGEGDGGSGGGSGGDGGPGEGSGSVAIIFSEDAVCGVDFISITPLQPGVSADQQQLEVFTPCGPGGVFAFVTNDAAIAPVAMECSASARAIYEPMFGVVNKDCGG